MGKPVQPTVDVGTSSGARREMLKAAVAGFALSTLPSVRIAAAATAALAPTVAMGYCKFNRNSNTRSVASNDTVVDAFSVASAPATYELSVVAVNAPSPLALVAQYPGGAEHTFWSAWSDQGRLQRSPPITIRWWALNRRPLPLVLRMSDMSNLTQVTAQSGLYVMAIGPNAQRLPAWNTLALRNNSLVTRAGSAVTFPYAVFSVSAI